MFNGKKLVALIATIAVMQSCAKGVNPTQNLQNADESTSQEQVQNDVNQTICFLQNDQDSDGDGICDQDDVAEDGTDCSQTDTCDGTTPDEQKKSRGWVPWVIGGSVVAIAGSWFATSKSGWGTKSWPKDLIDNNEQKDLDQMATFFRKDNPVTGLTSTADSKAEFYSKNNKIYSFSVNYLKLSDNYAFSQDYRSINGHQIRSGNEMAMCTSGVLGVQHMGAYAAPWQVVQADGVATNTVTTNVQRVRGTVYINKANYNLAAKEISRQWLTKAQFETYCRNHPGVYQAMSKKPKNPNEETLFYIYAFPLGLYKTFHEVGGDYALDTEYWFKGVSGAFPAAAATMVGTEYRSINPNFTTYQGLDKKIDSIGSQEQTAYNNCPSTWNTYNPAFDSVDDCRAAAVFGRFAAPGTPSPDASTQVKSSITVQAKTNLQQAVDNKTQAACVNAAKNPSSTHNKDLSGIQSFQVNGGTIVYYPCSN